MSPNVLSAEKSWTNGIRPTFVSSNSFTGLKMPNMRRLLHRRAANAELFDLYTDISV